MKYVGSKNRVAKQLLSIMLKGRKAGQWYVEPFVGGFNVIDKVGGKRIASDANRYLITLFQRVRGGWDPPKFVSESTYRLLKNNPSGHLPELVGFVGFGCSYAGKWFGGYARGNDNNGNPRNYADESRRNILKQRKALDGLVIVCSDYRELEIPPESIIYCDPPFAGTTIPYLDTKFDHEEFWNWVRAKSKEGHTVYVSEYNAPEDFEVVFERVVNNTLENDTGAKQGVEKLFRFRKDE